MYTNDIIQSHADVLFCRCGQSSNAALFQSLGAVKRGSDIEAMLCDRKAAGLSVELRLEVLG